MKIRMIGMLLVTVEILRNDSVLEVSCTVLDISQMYNFHNVWLGQGCNVRKVNCGCVYSAYILKPVLSGRNL